jgi:hypothetical protein
VAREALAGRRQPVGPLAALAAVALTTLAIIAAIITFFASG